MKLLLCIVFCCIQNTVHLVLLSQHCLQNIGVIFQQDMLTGRAEARPKLLLGVFQDNIGVRHPAGPPARDYSDLQHVGICMGSIFDGVVGEGC